MTVLGEAGVGKSRLVQEFAREVGAEATVLRGSCLPYGEGITYWPLGGSRPRQCSARSPRVQRSPPCFQREERADLIAELISEALGLSGTNVVGSEQTFWAVRRLFESVAETRPLVVVFDDLQWAEPTFIDLVDYVGEPHARRSGPAAVRRPTGAVRHPSRLGRRQATCGGDITGTAAGTTTPGV